MRRLEHAWGPWLTQLDARALAAQAPHLRATPRTASSTKRPATIQNMATWATSLGDVGPVLWSVVVCTIEGRGGEASQHVQKHPRRRHEADVGTCKVCMDKNIDCVIVPRGHLACCPRCARLVDAAGQRCPISAQDIAMIQQIFNA